jgi:hypothetical protein
MIMEPDNGSCCSMVKVTVPSGKCPPGAVLTLPYAEGYAQEYGLANLRIAHFLVKTRTWELLATTADPAKSTVSAPITALGTYVVTAVKVKDTQAPQLSWLAPAEQAELQVNTVLRVRAGDNVGISSITFCLDGQNIDEAFYFAAGVWRLDYDPAGVVPGAHTLSAVAIDPSGNTARITRTVILRSTGAAPLISARSALFGCGSEALQRDSEGYYEHAIIVNGRVTDPDGQISKVWLELDGKETGRIETREDGRWVGALEASEFPPGQHTLVARAADNARNTCSVTVPVTIPLSYVELTAEYNAARKVMIPLRLRALATGGEAAEYQFRVSKDGKTWATLRDFAAAAALTWKPAAAGHYTLQVITREHGGIRQVTGTLRCNIRDAKTGALQVEILPPAPPTMHSCP